MQLQNRLLTHKSQKQQTNKYRKNLEEWQIQLNVSPAVQRLFERKRSGNATILSNTIVWGGNIRIRSGVDINGTSLILNILNYIRER